MLNPCHSAFAKQGADNWTVYLVLLFLNNFLYSIINYPSRFPKPLQQILPPVVFGHHPQAGRAPIHLIVLAVEFEGFHEFSRKTILYLTTFTSEVSLSVSLVYKWPFFTVLICRSFRSLLSLSPSHLNLANNSPSLLKIYHS